MIGRITSPGCRGDHGPLKGFWRSDETDNPVAVQNIPDIIPETELFALSLARQVLRRPRLIEQRGDGLLADALGELEKRLGAVDASEYFATVNHAREDWKPAIVETIVAALRTGRALKFQYTTLEGKRATRLVQPARLVWIDLEPNLAAWDAERRDFRQFKISRMDEPRVQERPLEGAPRKPGLAAAIERQLAGAFGASLGSATPADNTRCAVLIDDSALLLVRDRNWGGNWQIEEGVSCDYPGRWHRLSFESSASSDDIARWVLGLGSHAIVTAPTEVVAIVREHVDAMAARQTL